MKQKSFERKITNRILVCLAVVIAIGLGLLAFFTKTAYDSVLESGEGTKIVKKGTNVALFKNDETVAVPFGTYKSLSFGTDKDYIQAGRKDGTTDILSPEGNVVLSGLSAMPRRLSDKPVNGEKYWAVNGDVYSATGTKLAGGFDDASVQVTAGYITGSKEKKFGIQKTDGTEIIPFDKLGTGRITAEAPLYFYVQTAEKSFSVVDDKGKMVSKRVYTAAPTAIGTDIFGERAGKRYKINLKTGLDALAPKK